MSLPQDPSRPVLRSAANPTIKHLIRMRNNRARRRAERVIVDGWRETGQAIQAGFHLIGIYMSDADAADNSDASPPNLPPDNAWRAQVMALADVRQRTHRVTPQMLEKISYGQSARGVVAEFQRPSRQLDQLRLPPHPLVLVLDQIEKPGNVGAMFRSAEAAGVSAVLISDGGDPLHPNAIRGSSGGVFHVPWAAGPADQVQAWLADHGVRPLAARVESSQSMYDTCWSGAVAIIVGSEADGLGDRWKTVNEQPVAGVHIPMAGRIDSLNVSVAAALLMFSALDSRRRS